MKSVEKFFLEHYGPSSSSAACTTRQDKCHSALPDEVREAANRGWLIFPVPQLARLIGNLDLLINEASSEISIIEQLAAEYYPLCGWRIVVGPTLFIVELDGPHGRNSYMALAQEQSECLTLQASVGDAALAFYRRRKGLELRASARKMAPGVRIFADGDSCVIGPFSNPWAEVETVPYWLQDLAFETPDTPRGKAAPLHVLSHRRVRCQTRSQFKNPQLGTRKSDPVSGHAGGRGGFRISRRS